MRLTSDVLVLAFVFALPACVFEAAACLPAPSAVVSEVCQRALADSPNANGSSEGVCENMRGEGVCVCVLGVCGGGGGQGAADTECRERASDMVSATDTAMSCLRSAAMDSKCCVCVSRIDWMCAVIACRSTGAT